jgi:hypothetical protein
MRLNVAPPAHPSHKQCLWFLQPLLAKPLYAAGPVIPSANRGVLLTHSYTAGNLAAARQS